MRTPTFEKKSQTPKNVFSSFSAVFCRKFCHADVDSREQQAILLKKAENFRPKLRFSCSSGDNFGTILSRRSRLSRTSRAPSRLSRPRPIDCDAGPEQTVKIFPFFCFNIRTSPKKVFSKGPASSPDLHPQKKPIAGFS